MITPPPTAAITVKDCSKCYPNGTHAVRDVSFVIKPGDFTVLLGLNGAGKTSLISMINGLNSISTGSIAICGHDIQTEKFQARKLLGVMPQEVNYNPFLSVQDTLIFYGGYYGMTPTEVMTRAQPLLEKARLWPKRNTLVRGLSGGMKRILMLIRALIPSPKVVILDEPTANLDMEIRDTIWSLLRELHAQGLTILLTTHNLEEAQELCENILVIHHGKLVFNRSIQEAISQLQERFYIISFAEPIQDYGFLAQQQYQRVDDKRISIRLDNNDCLAAILNQLHQSGPPLQHIYPANNQLEQILREAIL